MFSKAVAAGNYQLALGHARDAGYDPSVLARTAERLWDEQPYTAVEMGLLGLQTYLKGWKRDPEAFAELLGMVRGWARELGPAYAAQVEIMLEEWAAFEGYEREARAQLAKKDRAEAR